MTYPKNANSEPFPIYHCYAYMSVWEYVYLFFLDLLRENRITHWFLCQDLPWDELAEQIQCLRIWMSS
jgi:hypothetical protein